MERALASATLTGRRGRFEPTQYVWHAGIYVKEREWRLAFKSNTRPGFRVIATLAESCEKWNVPFSVFLEEPCGVRGLEVLVDVPHNARDGAAQRGCIELDSLRRVDLLHWLDEYVPKETAPAA